MRELLDEKLERFEELEKLMNDPDVLADSNRLAAVAREHGSLAKLCGKYRRFKELNAEIEEAKGCGHLFTYFMEYKKHHNGDLKLVLCGKSGMEIPKRDDIVSLGFVDDLDKYALMKNARVFVLASHFESLSIVVLESMMMGTPVLVNGACAVLKGHCLKSNAGLYFVNYTQFERTLTWLLTHPGEYEQMRENGRDYVKKNYQWPLITDRIVGLIEQVIADRKTAEKNSDPEKTGR